MQMQTQRFYHGSVLLTCMQSPSNPFEIFLILILKPTKSYTCTYLTNTLTKFIHLFSIPRRPSLKMSTIKSCMPWFVC